MSHIRVVGARQWMRNRIYLSSAVQRTLLYIPMKETNGDIRGTFWESRTKYKATFFNLNHIAMANLTV